MSKQHSLEELCRLHEDAGEWAEASKLFMQIMARDLGWGREFFQALRRDRKPVHYTTEEANSLDAREFEEEQSIGGQTYKERR